MLMMNVEILFNIQSAYPSLVTYRKEVKRGVEDDEL
jgi:hypothetical protein